MQDPSTSLLRCTCRRCGPNGTLLSLEQHSFHSKAHRLESTLLSDPWNARYAAGRTSSEVPPSAHSPESLSSAGRRMVMDVFKGLEDLDHYRDKLHTLRQCIFDPTELRFARALETGDGRAGPQLDLSERCNDAYLAHSAVLQGLTVSIDHIGVSNPHLRSSVSALKDEIKRDIVAHEAVLRDARRAVSLRNDAYKRTASNAEIFDPCKRYYHCNSTTAD